MVTHAQTPGDSLLVRGRQTRCTAAVTPRLVVVVVGISAEEDDSNLFDNDECIIYVIFACKPINSRVWCVTKTSTVDKSVAMNGNCSAESEFVSSLSLSKCGVPSALHFNLNCATITIAAPDITATIVFLQHFHS